MNKNDVKWFLAPISAEDAFDNWFRLLGTRGRDTLADLPASLSDQLRGFQKMFADAFEREKFDPAHVQTLPLYFDYIDDDEANAIASPDDGNYAFIGITRRLVFQISDVCILLSKSDGPICRNILGVRPSAEPYNELQGVLLYMLQSFVVAHEWAHHKMGHFGQLSNRQKLFHEVLDSGLAGSVDDQVKELAADSYATLLILEHIFDDRRSTFLPFIKFEPPLPPEHLDKVFLASFVMTIAGYLFLRPSTDLNEVNVYRLTHPPAATRLNFAIRQVASWCGGRRPALEDWIVNSFNPLMDAVVQSIYGVSSYREVFANELAFRKSDAGKQYDATLTAEESAYRKSWGNTDGTDDEETQFIEPPREIQFRLIPGPDDPEYRNDRAAFTQSLRAEDISFSSRARAFGGAGAEGRGILAIAITVLGPVALVQLRKFLETFLARNDRKMELSIGAFKFKGCFKDLEALMSSEQFQSLIAAQPQKAVAPVVRRRAIDKA